jgi:hypothetical protein
MLKQFAFTDFQFRGIPMHVLPFANRPEMPIAADSRGLFEKEFSMSISFPLTFIFRRDGSVCRFTLKPDSTFAHAKARLAAADLLVDGCDLAFLRNGEPPPLSDGDAVYEVLHPDDTISVSEARAYDFVHFPRSSFEIQTSVRDAAAQLLPGTPTRVAFSILGSPAALDPEELLFDAVPPGAAIVAHVEVPITFIIDRSGEVFTKQFPMADKYSDLRAFLKNRRPRLAANFDLLREGNLPIRDDEPVFNGPDTITHVHVSEHRDYHIQVDDSYPRKVYNVSVPVNCTVRDAVAAVNPDWQGRALCYVGPERRYLPDDQNLFNLTRALPDPPTVYICCTCKVSFVVDRVGLDFWGIFEAMSRVSDVRAWLQRQDGIPPDFMLFPGESDEPLEDDRFLFKCDAPPDAINVVEVRDCLFQICRAAPTRLRASSRDTIRGVIANLDIPFDRAALDLALDAEILYTADGADHALDLDSEVIATVPADVVVQIHISKELHFVNTRTNNRLSKRLEIGATVAEAEAMLLEETFHLANVLSFESEDRVFSRDELVCRLFQPGRPIRINEWRTYRVQVESARLVELVLRWDADAGAIGPALGLPREACTFAVGDPDYRLEITSRLFDAVAQDAVVFVQVMRLVRFLVDRTGDLITRYFPETATIAAAREFCLPLCPPRCQLMFYFERPDAVLRDDDLFVGRGDLHVFECRKVRIQTLSWRREWFFPLNWTVGQALDRIGLSRDSEFVFEGREVLRDKAALVETVDFGNRVVAIREPVTLTLVLPPEGEIQEFDTTSTATLAEVVRAAGNRMEDNEALAPGFYGAALEDEPPCLPLANLVCEFTVKSRDLFILRFDAPTENTLRLPIG